MVDGMITRLDSPADLTKKSMFGDEGARELYMTTTESIDGLSHVDDGELDDIIIITDVNGSTRSMRALSARIKKLGGRVLSRREDVATAIASLHLRRGMDDMLMAYVEDDYLSIIPIIDELSGMDESDVSMMTWDDLRARLPQRPGDVPPWGYKRGSTRVMGIDEYIFTGRTDAARTRLIRTLDGGANPLMITSWLLHQVSDSLIALMLMGTGMDWSEISASLGLPDPKYRGSGAKDPRTGKSGYPTYKRFTTAKRVRIPRMLAMEKSVMRADTALKGGERRITMSPRNIMIRMVIEACD